MASEVTCSQAQFLLFSLTSQLPSAHPGCKVSKRGLEPQSLPVCIPSMRCACSGSWVLPRRTASWCTECLPANLNFVRLSAFYWQRAPRRQLPASRQPPRSCVCHELYLHGGPRLRWGSAWTGPGKEPCGCCKTTGNPLLFSVFCLRSQ